MKNFFFLPVPTLSDLLLFLDPHTLHSPIYGVLCYGIIFDLHVPLTCR
jgi:hypothetical protein